MNPILELYASATGGPAPGLTFETFFVGEPNREAFLAAKSAADHSVRHGALLILCGGTGTGNLTICTASTWKQGASSARSVTIGSGWITVSLNTTNQATVSANGSWWDGTGKSGSWSGSITVPAY